ncbi:MAG: (2Fe-2S) ferredoxin domain-containing protein [Clostridiales bacterium]|nr:(2Fe-2S) ferredoxin domain-containing protein [Clostridiales bacterium]
MKTLAELLAIKEKLVGEISARKEHHGARIEVAMGTSGIEAGANKVLAKLSDLIIQSKKTDILVTQTPQTSLTGKEPVVTVVSDDGEKTVYINVSVDDAEKIVNQHIFQGKIVEELTIK